MTTPEPLSSIITAYATASAGMHPSHTLPRKLDAIAAAGFAHAEIAFPDLEAHAASLLPESKGGYKKLDQAGRGDVEKLEQAARDVAAQCARLDMRVLALMPCAPTWLLWCSCELTCPPGSPSSKDTRTQ